MDIAVVKHIAKVASDEDGFTKDDRVEVKKAWRGKVDSRKLDRAIDIFGDLVVNKREYRELLGFINPLFVYPSYITSRRILLEHQLMSIVGRYGRKVRFSHMISILNRALSIEDPSVQRALLRRIVRMRPRDEGRLFDFLKKVYQKRTMDPQAARLALKVFDKINWNTPTGNSRVMSPRGLYYHAKRSPALARDRSFMAKCIKRDSSCMNYINPELLRDRNFCRTVIDKNTFRYALRFLKRLPLTSALGIIYDFLQVNPSKFHLAVPFLKGVDPILAYITASEAVEDEPSVIKSAFEFIYAIDKEEALSLKRTAALKRTVVEETIKPKNELKPKRALSVSQRDKMVKSLIGRLKVFYNKGLYRVYPRGDVESINFPHRFARRIPKELLRDPRVQMALLKASHNEISYMVKHHPDIVLDAGVKREYYGLVNEAKGLNILKLERIYTTALLREILKNRKNVDRVDMRPLAVAIFARDHYEHDVFKFNELEKFSRHYRVLYFEADTVAKWFDAFERSTRKQRATLIYATGHGLRLGFRLGKVEFFTHQHAKKLKGLADRVSPSGHLIFLTCNGGNGMGRGYDMATAISDAIPHAFVHSVVDAVDIPSQKTTIAQGGRIVSIDSDVERVTLHAASGTHKIHEGGSGPHLLFPLKGWDNPNKKMSAIRYHLYLGSLGYRRGIKLHPQNVRMTVAERFLLDARAIRMIRVNR